MLTETDPAVFNRIVTKEIVPFSLGEDPKETVPQFLQIFQKIRGGFKNSPTFLDCGSGDGKILALASIAGFKSYGIEIDPMLCESSRHYLSQLTLEGVIPARSCAVSEGSYCFGVSNCSDKVIVQLETYARKFYAEDGIFYTGDFEQFVRELFHYDLKHLVGSAGKDPYTDLPAQFDVVYCYPYPGDPVFTHAFPLKLNKLIKPGGYFAVLGMNQDELPDLATKFLFNESIEIDYGLGRQAVLSLLTAS